MKFFTVTGASGSGKDLALHHMMDRFGLRTLHTYSTKTPRDDDVFFVQKSADWMEAEYEAGRMLEMAKFPAEEGGYHYYGKHSSELDSQHNYGIIIEENGLQQIVPKLMDLCWDVHTLFIDARADLIKERLLKKEPLETVVARMKRDEKREYLPHAYFSQVIENNDGIDEFTHRLNRFLVDHGL